MTIDLSNRKPSMAEQARDAARAERDAAQAEVARLQSELDRLQLRLDRIYEIWHVAPDEPDSVIHMVEAKRAAWAAAQGWQPEAESLTAQLQSLRRAQIQLQADVLALSDALSPYADLKNWREIASTSWRWEWVGQPLFAPWQPAVDALQLPSAQAATKPRDQGER